MTNAEKAELALIPIVGVVAWMLSDRLPARIGVGTLLLAASVLLLLQGLVRDLWLLSRRNHAPHDGAHRQALCMCVESTVGVTGVAAGLMLLGSGVDLTLSVAPWQWCMLAAGVLSVGFAIKDFILEWRPFRIRRDKDHLNIVVSWKR